MPERAGQKHHLALKKFLRFLPPTPTFQKNHDLMRASMKIKGEQTGKIPSAIVLFPPPPRTAAPGQPRAQQSQCPQTDRSPTSHLTQTHPPPQSPPASAAVPHPGQHVPPLEYHHSAFTAQNKNQLYAKPCLKDRSGLQTWPEQQLIDSTSPFPIWWKSQSQSLYSWIKVAKIGTFQFKSLFSEGCQSGNTIIQI